MRAALLAAAVALVWAAPAAEADRAKRKAKPAKKRKAKPEPAPAPDPAPIAEPEPEIELEGDSAAAPAPAPQAVDAEPALTGTAELAATTQAAPAPAAAAAPKQRRFRIRAGVAHVKPLAQSRELELADIDGAASLAVDNGPIPGSGATVDSATIPAIIIGYQLPYLDGRLALETVLGLPFTVKFKATGTLANESIAPMALGNPTGVEPLGPELGEAQAAPMALGIPTGVEPLGPELGEAKAAPPMVTAVYTFNHREMLRPYVGAGLALLFAFDAKVTNPTLIEVSQPEFEISPAPGVVLQGGLEARITDRIFARLDVKFIALMMARGEVHHIQVRTPELPLFDTVEVGTAKMNVWVNPLVVQAGVGTDF